MTIQIKWEQALIEESVFLVIKLAEETGETALAARFHDGINHVYDQFTGETRESALGKFYEDSFHQLGLAAIFENVVREFPLIVRARIPISVRRVWDRKLEGAELYVRDEDKMVLVGIQTVRLLDRKLLTSFLRHELMHVSDMLDPVFQYQPDSKLGGINRIEDDLIRRRFQLLWNLYVSIRILKMGHVPFLAAEQLKTRLTASFPLMDQSAQEDKLDQVLGRENVTQEELLALARGERSHRLIGEGGHLCPLCGFTSFDRVDYAKLENRSVAQTIQTERPDWTPSLSSCRQCLELYQTQNYAGVYGH